MKNLFTHVRQRTAAITLLLMLLNCMSVMADKFEMDGIYYSTTGDNIAKVTYNNYEIATSSYKGTVSIPSEVKYENVTYKVTEIDGLAFYNCTDLNEVKIPNSVTTIGMEAFMGSGIKSITIPNSVTTFIEWGHFSNCTNLKNVKLPDTIQSIPNSMFQGCSSLESIDIPISVKSIEYSAFEGCSNLNKITIPSSVTSIYNKAFRNCKGLKNINIPSSITYLEGNPFYGCI